MGTLALNAVTASDVRALIRDVMQGKTAAVVKTARGQANVEGVKPQPRAWPASLAP
jgi:hypothetical protein